MSPTRQSLVSLAVILIALAASAWAWRLKPPPPPPPSAGIETVLDVPASAVRAIDVESWQGALRAAREDGGWRVRAIELRQAAADPAGPGPTPTPVEVNETLDALVGEIVSLPEIDRFPLGGRPLADFGLAQPQARITLALDSGERKTLELGELTVTTAALYARIVPSDDVLEVGTLVFNDVAAALFRLRALATSSNGPAA